MAVAFSGGVDSTFCLQAAKDVLGGRRHCSDSSIRLFPDRGAGRPMPSAGERNPPDHLPRKILKVPGVAENPANRCYLCKRALFEMFLAQAKRQGFSMWRSGSNLMILGLSSGSEAIAELGI